MMSGAPSIIVAVLLGLGFTWSVSAANDVPAAPVTSDAIATGADGAAAGGSQSAVATRLDRIGRIIAPVMINGRGPYHFMLDTGANRTVLAESLLQQLDLPLDQNHLISVIGVSGSAVVATAQVHSLDAGALHFHDVQLPVLSGPVLLGIDGILGMDGLEGKLVSADFVKDQLTISQSLGRPASFAYSVIPVKFLSQRLLMIDTYVGNVRAKAIIDTGGARTLGNPALLRALLRAHRTNEAFGLDAGVVDATQSSLLGKMGRVPHIELGSATIDNLDVTFGDFRVFTSWGLQNQPALLLGMDVLGTLAELTIDYRRHELDLIPRVYHLDIDSSTVIEH
jgi:predicted aspartyl protease